MIALTIEIPRSQHSGTNKWPHINTKMFEKIMYVFTKDFLKETSERNYTTQPKAKRPENPLYSVTSPKLCPS